MLDPNKLSSFFLMVIAFLVLSAIAFKFIVVLLLVGCITMLAQIRDGLDLLEKDTRQKRRKRMSDHWEDI